MGTGCLPRLGNCVFHACATTADQGGRRWLGLQRMLAPPPPPLDARCWLFAAVCTNCLPTWGSRARSVQSSAGHCVSVTNADSPCCTQGSTCCKSTAQGCRWHCCPQCRAWAVCRSVGQCERLRRLQWAHGRHIQCICLLTGSNCPLSSLVSRASLALHGGPASFSHICGPMATPSLQQMISRRNGCFRNSKFVVRTSPGALARTASWRGGAVRCASSVPGNGQRDVACSDLYNMTQAIQEV